MFSFLKSGNLKMISKKVIRNASLMFIVYIVFIITGILGFIFIKKEFLAVISLILSFILSTFLIVLISAYFLNKYKPYSLLNPKLQKQYTMETLEENLAISTKLGDRLAISQKYIFSLFSSFYIPAVISASDLTMAYFTIRHNYRKSPYSETLYILTNSNKLYKFPLGAKILLSDLNIHARVLSEIKNMNSNIMVGYYRSFFATKNINKLSKDLR